MIRKLSDRCVPPDASIAELIRDPNIVANGGDVVKIKEDALLRGRYPPGSSRHTDAGSLVTTEAILLHPCYESVQSNCLNIDRRKPISTTSKAPPPAATSSRRPVTRPTYPALRFTPLSEPTKSLFPSDDHYLHAHAPKVDIILALGICGSLLGLVCGQMELERSSRPAFNVPEILHPTPLQLTTPHFRMIDRLPFPRMRDNLILLAHTVKIEELFADFFTMDSFTLKEGGLPWDPKAWQISVEFAEKWGYLLN